MNVKLEAFQRAADFDTGWSACGAGVTYVFTHGIGALPTFAIVEIAQNSGGSGWRVPAMATSYYDGGAWRQTGIVAMDTTLRTHGSLAHFRYTATGTNLAPSSGFRRIQLFNWTPDYDSGWTAFSTTIGSRDSYFEHDLDQIPSLMMLWIAQAPNGGDWILPHHGKGDQKKVTYFRGSGRHSRWYL